MLNMLDVNYAICYSPTKYAPVGHIIAHTGPVPVGTYLECNGRAVSKTRYAALYNVLGTSWGSSETMFNLPDLRGLQSHSRCIMCKQYPSEHISKDGHPFCNSPLEYLEWKYNNANK